MAYWFGPITEGGGVYLPDRLWRLRRSSEPEEVWYSPVAAAWLRLSFDEALLLPIATNLVSSTLAEPDKVAGALIHCIVLGKVLYISLQTNIVFPNISIKKVGGPIDKNICYSLKFLMRLFFKIWYIEYALKYYKLKFVKLVEYIDFRVLSYPHGRQN